MAKTDEKVMDMVAKELQKDPDIGVGALREKASKVNPEMASLTLRQFNARYPLQVKRRQKAASGDAKKKAAPTTRSRRTGGRRARSRKAAPQATPTTVDRDAIRTVFHRFARELMAAGDQPHKLVDAMASVDKYVDQVVKAAS